MKGENIVKLEETYNIHKVINSIFSFFKSKWLCKKGIHNYRLSRMDKDFNVDLICFCCGKKEKLEEE